MFKDYEVNQPMVQEILDVLFTIANRLFGNRTQTKNVDTRHSLFGFLGLLNVNFYMTLSNIHIKFINENCSNYASQNHVYWLFTFVLCLPAWVDLFQYSSYHEITFCIRCLQVFDTNTNLVFSISFHCLISPSFSGRIQ